MNNWLRRTINARISLLKKWRKAYEEQNRLFPRDYDSKAIQKLTKQIEELQAVTDWLKTAGKDTNVPTKNEPCEDCISRQQTKEMLKKLAEYHTGDRFNADRIIRNVNELPPVEPQEPKTGRWVKLSIFNCNTDFKCSECGYIHNFVHPFGKPTAHYTYCPKCGAKMESEVE